MRNKLETAIGRVCRGRNISLAEIDRVVRRIEAGLVDSGVSTVRSVDIALMVMEELKVLDQVSFQRMFVNYADREEKPAKGRGARNGGFDQFSLFADEEPTAE